MKMGRPFVGKRIVPLVIAFAAAALAVGILFDAREGTMNGSAAAPLALAVSPETAVVEDDANEVLFRMRNAGSTPVSITAVVPHCGCTVAGAAEPQTIPAGGESTVRVKASPPQSGEKQTYIDFHYQGMTAGPLRASLLLRGRPPSAPMVQFQPQEVIVRGSTGSTASSDFAVNAIESRAADRWIESAESDSSDVEVSLIGTQDVPQGSGESVRREYRFRITASLKQRGRKRLAVVSLRVAAAPNGPAPTPISVMSDCSAVVEAIPDTIFASLAEADLPREFKIRFRSRSGGEPLALSPAGVPNWLEVGPAIETDAGSPFAAEMHVRVVELPNSADGKPLRTTLSIGTNVPEMPNLEIPVTILKRG